MLATGGSDQEKERPKPGMYVANCYRLVDLGTQTTSYGTEKKTRRKIIITWEINQMMADGRPFSVSQRFTLSLFKNSILRKTLESWRSIKFTDQQIKDGFDVSKVVGAPCYVNLVESEDGQFIDVAGVMNLPKEIARMPRTNPALVFDLGKFNPEIFAGLSDYLKKIIVQSPEYAKAIAPPAPAAGGVGEAAAGAPKPAGKEVDEIPF